MTDADKLTRAISGDYIGDSATLGRILIAEIRRVTRERDYALGVLERLADPELVATDGTRLEPTCRESAAWYRRVAGEAVGKITEGRKL